MRYFLVGILAFSFTFSSHLAYGEDKFGIQIYTGAVLEKEETDFLRTKGGAASYCYRTNDSVKKVIAFYMNQPGLVSFGFTENGGMLIKETNDHIVYIKVESPWQPWKGGERKNDTIIVLTME